MEKMELRFLMLGVIFCLPAIVSSRLTDLGVLQSSAENLDNFFQTRLDTVSQRENLTQIYKSKTSAGDIQKINGQALVTSLAEDLKKILDAKVEAIQKAVDFAEKIAAEYAWKKDLVLEEVQEEYVHAKRINDSGPDYEYSEQFKQKVDFNTSSVHIPVEIYEGDINILNGLMWTNRLHEIWKENRESDPKLLWQYFGTQSGIMRNYPASKWRGTGVDLYDVRRRPWYTQGASSPKDMFILIDTSGSTHGQALALMIQSVISLLDTLGENDFLNAGYFAAEPGFVACFDSFVQANHWNKQVLIQKVKEIEAKGMAKYEVGFEFAFEQFEKLENDTLADDEHGQCARCNQLIMFLTDGGTDMPEKTFKKHNWDKGNKTRIFTYAVGPTANPIAAVKWIACSNRGYFYKIPAMGAIRTAVQHYLNLLGNGIYEKSAQVMQWTHAYQDRWGLGMMTTVTMPVYNTISWTEDQSNQTILGVMGSDVTVQELEENIPMKQLGPNGYAFAINSNGYVVFHPNLKAVEGYLSDPPNVDFLDVEYESPLKEELRREMIDQETNHKSIAGFVVVPGGQHLDNMTREYYYTGIKGTTFSVAIVLPEHSGYYFSKEDPIPVSTGIDSLQTSGSSAIFLSTLQQYCENMTGSENNTWQSVLDQFIGTVTEKPDSCDEDLLSHLFFDADVTKSMEGTWGQSLIAGYETVFVATDSGLTRVYSKNKHEDFERFEAIKDVWKEVYYRRAMDNQDLWMFFSMYDSIARKPQPPTTASPGNDTMMNETESEIIEMPPLITVTAAIKLPDYKPAVIGLQISQKELISSIMETVDDCKKPNILCYLLDDAGYLIVSTDEAHAYDVGKPFEEVELVLAETLLQKGILIQKEHYDYQGVCVPSKKTASAGFRSVVPPAIFELLTLKWWTAKVAWAYFNFNIYNMVTSLFATPNNQAMASEADYSMMNYSCIKKGAQYYRSQQDTNFAFKDWAKCGNCSRGMFAAKFKRSNLLLVVADKDCKIKDHSCYYNDIVRDYSESTDPNFTPEGNCNVTRRYRRRPKGCYDFNAYEDKDCGSGSVIRFNIYTSLLAVFSTIALTQVLTSSTSLQR